MYIPQAKALSQLKATQTTLLGDSRKYPYHTTGDILEFRGRGGGFLDWNSEDVGG